MLNDCLFEPKCKFCQFRRKHPDAAALVEYQIIQKRRSYPQVLSYLKEDYGISLSSDQLRNHIKKHLPDHTVIVQDVLERGLEGISDIRDLTKQNLVVYQIIKELGVSALKKGDLTVDLPTLIRAVEAQTKTIEGDRIVIEDNRRPSLMSPNILKRMLEIVYDFVPPNRRLEFRERVEKELFEDAKQEAYKVLAIEKAQKTGDEGDF